MEWFRPGLSRVTRASCLGPLAAVVAIAALAVEPDDHEHAPRRRPTRLPVAE